MTTISAYGLSASLPAGWEAVIYCRPPSVAGTTHPILHAATFGLPVERGDFGGGAVELMGPGDAMVVLLEYHPDSVGRALFARPGLPQPLSPDAFSPACLQRAMPGQAGVQLFFNQNGRAFCLYAVLGSYSTRYLVVPSVNTVLAGVQIGGGGM
jgi:hypothetical protein